YFSRDSEKFFRLTVLPKSSPSTTNAPCTDSSFVYLSRSNGGPIGAPHPVVRPVFCCGGEYSVIVRRNCDAPSATPRTRTGVTSISLCTVNPGDLSNESSVPCTCATAFTRPSTWLAKSPSVVNRESGKLSTTTFALSAPPRRIDAEPSTVPTASF